VKSTAEELFDPAGRRRVTSIEVRPAYEAAWTTWPQSKMEGTSWQMSNNYFTSKTGNIVTQWPSGNMLYLALTKCLGRISERATTSTVHPSSQ
jgi:hypothetical protein